MYKNLFYLLTLLPLFSVAQINFEKGYFIDNSNQRVECFIKNLDWKNNSKDFDYKISENSEEIKTTIEKVKEFEIYNSHKFIRTKIKADLSSEYLKDLSFEKNPIFKEEELLLKVLIEGNANLYSFENGNGTKFFYTLKDKSIEQLIFKSYRVENKIAENNYYKQQLFNNLKCENITLNEIEKIKYDQKSLINVFTKYNSCTNSESINFENKVKKDLFNLTIRPGMNISSFEVNNNSNVAAVFNKKTNLRIGLEAEFILGFNKNKWAVIIEPTYQSYKSDVTTQTYNFSFSVDYKSIEVPIGIRHYFFLNNDSKFFINGSYVTDFAMNSSFIFKNSMSFKISNRSCFAFGIGYKYNDKFSIEIRQFTTSDLLPSYTYYESRYKSASLIFGYTMF